MVGVGGVRGGKAVKLFLWDTFYSLVQTLLLWAVSFSSTINVHATSQTDSTAA